MGNVPIDFMEYERSKYSVIAMLGLKPSSDEEEKEAISSVLNYNSNIDAYIFDHLDGTDNTYYVVNKVFFDSWRQNIGFGSGLDKSSFQIKKGGEKLKSIDNASLMEPNHALRMKDVTYGTDFVIVPRFVFFPLSKWYPCNRIIERQVVKYSTSTGQAKISVFKATP